MADPQTGYDYRDSSTEVSSELVSPREVYQAKGVPTRQTVGQRSVRGAAIAKALMNVAEQELGELKQAADERQAAEGAIRAGQGEAIESIRKRSTASDWVFGTKAKVSEAAAVHASAQVTTWTSDSLQDLPDMVEVHPDDYAEVKRQEIAGAAADIEDPALRAAFITQANQRLQKLVAIQMDSAHEHMQETAKNNYQIDLKKRIALVQQAEAMGGLAYDMARDDLILFFQTRPYGMTPEAHQLAIAEAIIQTALDGDRTLYNFAKQEGMLDDMPEEMRTQLEESYEKAAPTNDIEFIDALDRYNQDMDNISISPEQFRQKQIEFYNKWDEADTKSDEEYAADRRRHKALKEAGTKKVFDLETGVTAYARGDVAYVSRLTNPQKQTVANTWMERQVRNQLPPEQQLAFDQKSDAERTSAVFEFLYTGATSDNPDTKAAVIHTMQRVARHSKNMNVEMNSLQGIFEDSISTLVMSDGSLNPNAIGAFNLAHLYMNADGSKHLTNLVNNDTMADIYQFNNLKILGSLSDEQIMTQLQAARDNPDAHKRISKDDKATAARKYGVKEFAHVLNGGRWWSDDDWTQNEDDVTQRLHVTAAQLLNANPALAQKEAYQAAGRIEAEKHEKVGNAAVYKGSTQPLSILMGFDNPVRNPTTGEPERILTLVGVQPDQAISTAFNLASNLIPEHEGFPVDAIGIDWDKAFVTVDVPNQIVTLAPIGNDADFEHTDAMTLTFKQIRILNHSKERIHPNKPLATPIYDFGRGTQ